MIPARNMATVQSPGPESSARHRRSGDGFHPLHRMYHYHAGANAALTAGILGGIAAHTLGFATAWVGFSIPLIVVSIASIVRVARAND